MVRVGNFLRLLTVSGMVVLLVACMPVGDETINTELFKNQEELKAKSSELKPGMSKYKVFKKLNIPVEKFSVMSTEEIQAAVYGNAQVQGSPDELEKFRKKLAGYDGYYLPYRELKSNSSLGFGKMKMKKKGYDLRLVLIFENKKLIKSAVTGSPNVVMKEDKYMWNAILRKGTGFGF